MKDEFNCWGLQVITQMKIKIEHVIDRNFKIELLNNYSNAFLKSGIIILETNINLNLNWL